MLALFLLYAAGVFVVVISLSLSARFFGRRYCDEADELTDPSSILGIAVFWPISIIAALIVLLGWTATHAVDAIIGPRR